jgi:hypothetical protein
MKKVVLTLTASLACLAAFGQGKILFTTDSLHLAYYNNGANAGQAITLGNGGSGLTADLYLGTSSTSLFLYSSTTFTATPGKWSQLSVLANANSTTGAPLINAGTAVFVVAQMRGAGDTPANQLNGALLSTPDAYAASLGYTAYGWSQEFQFTLGGAPTYPAMYTAPSWAQGSFDLSSSAGAGARGAIATTVGPVPEPTSFALLGLGTAAMMIFRRRK